VITTIPADLIILFIVGMIFSLGTYQNIEKAGSVLRNKYFLAALLFNTIFCLPIGIYCYAVFPDWCWMYWLDSRDAPLWLVVAAFVFYYVSFACGFVSAYFLEKNRRGLGQRGLGTALLVFIVFAAVNYKRLFFVGSIDEFREGDILIIFQRPFISVVAFGGMLVALAALVIILSHFGTEIDHHLSQDEIDALSLKKRKVSVTKIADGDLRKAITDSLREWEGLDYLAGLLDDDRPVLIKPNLAGGGRDKVGSQTSPSMIGAVIEIIRELDPDARILIGESGSIVWWDLGPLLAGSGHEKLFEEKGCEFVNLSKGEKVRHDFGGRMGRELISGIFRQDPVIVDLPVAKTHAFYRMSGAIKNMFGITPVPIKFFRYHMKGFADWDGRVFLDIYRNFPPHLVIIDGTVSGEGYCPVAGQAKETGFIVTADDALSADMVLAKIMGFDLKGVPYLWAAIKEKMVPEYDLFGISPEDAVPEKWRRTRLRLWGLLLNTIQTIIEHGKAMRT
jgi:uncharacterized protein (DUF362 family)